MKISTTLKQKRIELKLSQNEVAEQLFVTRQTISNWENDRSYPDLENLVLLSQLYNFSLDELFLLNKEEPKNFDTANRKQYAWSTSTIASSVIVFILLAVTLFLSFGGDEKNFMNYISNAASIIVLLGFCYIAWALEKNKIQLPKKLKIVLNIILITLFFNAGFQFSLGVIEGFLANIFE